MANSPSGESVVERFLKILEAFDARHTSLTVSAVARRSGLPLTTTYRLASEMLKLGVLERSESGTVRIGVRMWELSYRSSETQRLREAALPFMHDVQDVVREHTNLAVLDEHEVIYLERLSAPRSVANLAYIASRLPLHACSSGLVLMAWASPQAQEAFLARRHEKVTPHTPTDPAEIRRRLAETRQLRYCYAREYVTPGSAGIAVPIVDGANVVVAALSVIMPATQSIGVVLPPLQMAAKGISRAIAMRDSRRREQLAGIAEGLKVGERSAS